MYGSTPNCGGVLSRVGCIIRPFLLLAVRLIWGLMLFYAGWQKLHNIAPTAEFFSSLGIFLPHLSAYLVGGVEALGGIFIVLGFLTRFSSLLLSIVMITALFTAHKAAFAQGLGNFQEILTQPPITFLVVLLFLFSFGPGCLSLDAFFSWIKNRNSNRYE